MATTTRLEQQGNTTTTGDMIVLNGALARSILTALADEFSRTNRLLHCDEGKTVQEISLEQAVPLSTCYRRTSELARNGLLMVERIVVTGEGKRFAVYRSSFKCVQISSNLEVMPPPTPTKPRRRGEVPPHVDERELLGQRRRCDPPVGLFQARLSEIQ